MATALKLRRGTTAQHASFTGAEGEVTVDTTKDTVVVHDGSTAGGVPLAKETGSAISATSLTDSGNLTFTGTGNRITGDFSNATIANRVMFQTSTANNFTDVIAIPNGTGTLAQFASYAQSDVTNASFLSCRATAATDARILSGITGTGTYLPMTFFTGGSERMRIDTSGNVGIGTSSPSGSLDIQSTSGDSYLRRFAASTSGPTYYFDKSRNATVGSNTIVQSGDTLGRILWRGANGTGYTTAAEITAEVDGTPGASNDMPGRILFLTTPDGSGTLTERMRIDSSGNVIVGGTTAINSAAGRGNITINGSSNAILNFGVGNAQKGYIYHGGTDLLINNAANGIMQFYTNDTERARITSAGDFVVGTTTTPGQDITSGTGMYYQESNGFLYVRSDGQVVGAFNRGANDGIILEFKQDQTIEGTISVSGNTVSYNAFAGSHWSQLSDGSKPEILRGTVMESIDELCQWPDEPTSERLCRVKISDTAGSKKVYGVFMAWDNDWTATNDMLVTSLGAFVCRVNKDVVVQQGDLLESNGDGTARVQTDDIIRSSTIGKVTSTVKTHEHPDGSYCVPTVLYCG